MKLPAIFKNITESSFWKERAITIFMVTGYLVGNGVEMISGKVTEDSPIVWILGTLLGITVIGISISKNLGQQTQMLFKIFLFYLNFNLIYAYSTSTHYCRTAEEAVHAGVTVPAANGAVQTIDTLAD